MRDPKAYLKAPRVAASTGRSDPLGDRGLGCHHRHDVGAVDVSSNAGRGNALVSESIRGNIRGGLWIFVCYRRGAHQRFAGQLFQSHQRHEHRDFDGYLRDFLSGRLDGAELCGACVDDWRSRLHRGGDCGARHRRT